MKSMNLGPSPFLDIAEYAGWEIDQEAGVQGWWNDCLEADALEMQMAKVERDAEGGNTLTEEVATRDVVTKDMSRMKRISAIASDVFDRARKCLGLSR